MKFFTPELYIRFNSPNEEEADRADETWEKALRDYSVHLDELREDMPPRVKTLADNCCFHDAEMLSIREEESEPLALRSTAFLPFLPLAVLTLKQDESLIVLIYLLWNKIRPTRPQEGWHFSSHKRHWLYDEIDVDNRGPGIYWQRILLSDGATIEIPFFDVFVQTVVFQTSEIVSVV